MGHRGTVSLELKFEAYPGTLAAMVLYALLIDAAWDDASQQAVHLLAELVQGRPTRRPNARWVGARKG